MIASVDPLSVDPVQRDLLFGQSGTFLRWPDQSSALGRPVHPVRDA
ncbi:hypothetical protein ACPOL_2836 [Acidisarcina polymorpha]|uniref:Uncharacterized protein n=1 Tax=Acidisarcina polymorpha TaxID=2211140 RepID=A0A2Z5FZA5_9BACT|nr:hypothetical protein ACPOL_2836 [Acidisarcina polymorpha]